MLQFFQTHPQVHFRRRIETTTDKHSDPSTKNTSLGDSEKLCCIMCNTLITDWTNKTMVMGRSEHQFTNPAAISFHVACFSQVENCRPQGLRTPQDTWFPGHSWQITLCNHCGLHLGWHFTGPNDFYALIVNRLRIVSDN